MAIQGFALVPAQAMQATPAMVAFASLLELGGADVDAAVARELAENPALVSERPTVMVESAGPTLRRFDRPAPSTTVRRAADPPAPIGWRHALVRDARLELPSDAADLAAIVVGSLDERGFLREEPEAIASLADVPLSLVEQVVKTVREVGPAGIAARDGRECLLLQVDRWGETGPTAALARVIVEGHLADLAARRFARIAAALDVDVAAVGEAHARIVGRLRPAPALGPDPGDPSDPIRASRPDIAITRRRDDPTRFRVTVLEAERFGLSVDRDLGTAAAGAALAGMVRRAEGFLARLQERWATLHAIASFVTEREVAFLDDGPRAYVPLTRAGVAAAIGLHESTVSRATADKLVELPSRQVVPFATFFDTSQGLRALVRDLIDAAPRRLSDGELSAQLMSLGHPVARRTVAKYRRQLGIAPAPVH
jgi:RNA polymerase sigma-54 factor